MRLAYFTNEVPFPANHGGRVDTWTRLQAMQAAGAHIALVSWYAAHEEPLSKSTLDALSRLVSSVQLFAIRLTWREYLLRMVQLVRWPSHVSSRVPVGRELQQFWQEMDAFKPEAVWLDALYGTVLARACAKRYGIPMFYRSHNIEHRYMAGQVQRAQSWRDRLAWRMNLPHLKQVEFDTLHAAHTCFDISQDDLRWWQQHGVDGLQWLAPSVSPKTIARLTPAWDTPPNHDVGYLGNLRTPNNVEGVLWYLQNVWPQIRSMQPTATMVLAGSSPADSIRAAAVKAAGVTLIENAPDTVAVLRDARVLVNPVFGGSGVNIKSVEMLFAPGQRVSTSQGVAGLPPHVQQRFHVTDEAAAFAQAVVAAISATNKSVSAEESQALETAREEFGFARIQTVLTHIESVCAQQKR